MAQMIEAGHASQNNAQPSPSVIRPKHGDEEVTEDHRDRQHDQIDQECKEPPRQYAAKQLRLQIGIERMRFAPRHRYARRRRYYRNRYTT